MPHGIRLHGKHPHIDRRQSTVLPEDHAGCLHLRALDRRLPRPLFTKPTNRDQTSSTSHLVRLLRLLSHGRLSSPIDLAGLLH